MKHELPVLFPFVHETHETSKFRAEGHSLMALRRLDAEGNPVQGPDGNREWGPEVHILRLPHPDDSDPKTYVLRVMSDSIEDAERMAKAELRRMLYGLWAAQFIRESQAVDVARLCAEREALRNVVERDYGTAAAEKATAGVAPPRPTAWRALRLAFGGAR